MPIQVLVGALAVAAAIPLLVFSLAAPGQRWLFGRRHNVLGQAPDVRQLVLNKSAWERLGQPFSQSIGATLVRVSPKVWADRLNRTIGLAGLWGRTSVERILVVKVALGTGLLLAGWLFLVPRVDLGWLITLPIAGLGFMLPDLWLSRRAEERQRRIQLELPDVLDQITMSVDAGLGFEAALARTARVGDGPLAYELGRVGQEMQLGMSHSEALRNLADRTDVPDLKSFVLMVAQSEQYGLSIAKVLGIQAAELRDKRQLRAEERALKIPVLLIFPLAICIFPTIFIVMLGPALIRVFRDLTIVTP